MGSILKTFVLTFVVTFVVATVVNYLWNLIGHGAGIVEWRVPFTFAIILGIVLTWISVREARQNEQG
jgi:hypothetical protein